MHPRTSTSSRARFLRFTLIFLRVIVLNGCYFRILYRTISWKEICLKHQCKRYVCMNDIQSMPASFFYSIGHEASLCIDNFILFVPILFDDHDCSASWPFFSTAGVGFMSCDITSSNVRSLVRIHLYCSESFSSDSIKRLRCFLSKFKHNLPTNCHTDSTDYNIQSCIIMRWIQKSRSGKENVMQCSLMLKLWSNNIKSVGNFAAYSSRQHFFYFILLETN